MPVKPPPMRKLHISVGLGMPSPYISQKPDLPFLEKAIMLRFKPPMLMVMNVLTFRMSRCLESRCGN